MSRKIVVLLALVLAVCGAWACKNGAKSGPKEVVIADSVPAPWSLHVSRGAAGHPDQVVWKNNDNTDHTVSFSITPFDVADLRINVPAHGSSRTFTVGRGAAVGSHLYEVHSAFTPANSDSGPGPVVIVDE